MKKLLIIASMSALAVAANAQGLVSFNNSSAASTKISTNSVVGGASTGLTTIGNGNYYYELFGSSNSVANGNAAAVMPTGSGALLGTYVFSDSTWIDLASAQSGTTRAGQVTGPSPVTDPATAGGAGATGNFIVIGWSANIGSTIAALEAYLASPTLLPGGGYVGQSNVGNVALGNGSSLPTLAVFGNGVNGILLGLIPVVPEPATIALMTLGGASLLLFRRRKV